MALTLRQKAQTAIELAVFGSILIFVLGVIIRTVLIRNHEQQAQLRATRMALTLSYTISNPPQNQIASHNSASILVIEDRLTAASSKYGAVDRTPFLVQASGSHTANMFMPVDYGDSADLPMLDVYVNGKHFSFTTATFTAYNLPLPGQVVDPTCGCTRLYTIIDNHPKVSEWCDDSPSATGVACPPACSVGPSPGCNLSAAERFDLARDGSVIVPPSQRERFAWQWFLVAAWNEDAGGAPPIAEGIHVDNRKNLSVDVDGDLKLEQVERILSSGTVITSLGVRDFQNGDIDLTFNDSDTGWQPGFTRDAQIYTFVNDDSSPGGGTYLQIDEGKLYSTNGDERQFIRTASKKDTIDVIERVFQLSNNTGRLCEGITPKGAVEVCADAGGCFTSANLTKTCMDTSTLLLFIRSRITDLRGRKWVTPTGDDPYIGFDR
jgi:hypothetical protein